MPPSKKILLRRWTKWLFEQNPSDNAADDPDGSIVESKNSGNIWYIPGTWGLTGVPSRTIDVPSRTWLFLVVGSSHAIYDELKPVPHNPTNLSKLANQIADAWTTLKITIDGLDYSAMIDREETDPFDVDIPAGSPVYPNSLGTQKMVTVGHVFMFPLGAAGTTHTIYMEARSPKKPDIGKPPGQRKYEVQVTYTVNVV